MVTQGIILQPDNASCSHLPKEWSRDFTDPIMERNDSATFSTNHVCDQRYNTLEDLLVLRANHDRFCVGDSCEIGLSPCSEVEIGYLPGSFRASQHFLC